jgi:hypothetical protein
MLEPTGQAASEQPLVSIEVAPSEHETGMVPVTPLNAVWHSYVSDAPLRIVFTILTSAVSAPYVATADEFAKQDVEQALVSTEMLPSEHDIPTIPAVPANTEIQVRLVV